ncbi:MAG: hypothetical protein ACX94B_00680 [Henriciella sp.]
MTTRMQALYGLALILIGGVKIWLHMGSVSVLSLPLCSGKTLTVSAGQMSLFEQAHCWGCYVFGAGLILVGVAAFGAYAQRRTVAAQTD